MTPVTAGLRGFAILAAGLLLRSPSRLANKPRETTVPQEVLPSAIATSGRPHEKSHRRQVLFTILILIGIALVAFSAFLLMRREKAAPVPDASLVACACAASE